MLDRLLPEWVRGSKILDNDGDGYTTSSGGEAKIAHGLGRPHRGWFLVSVTRAGAGPSNPAREVFEDTAPDLSLTDTHLQLQYATGTKFEINFSVVIF